VAQIWPIAYQNKYNLKMNQFELPAMLEDELPMIASELKQNTVLGSVGNTVKIFTNYTKRMLALHDLPAVVRCMGIADKIYDRGNQAVKSAIENVFVYSFSGLRCACDKLEWRLIQAKMPVTLYSIYVRQIYKSGL
jgi:hypothetical protein